MLNPVELSSKIVIVLAREDGTVTEAMSAKLVLLILALSCSARCVLSDELKASNLDEQQLLRLVLLGAEITSTDGSHRIRLTGSSVTESTVKHLKAIPAIEEVILLDTEITDRGIETLGELRGLKTLGLRSTRITDSGLKSLRTLESLERLHLDGNQITDDGIRHLKGLPNLKVLSVSDTQISRAGRRILRSKFPGAIVLPFDPDVHVDVHEAIATLIGLGARLAGGTSEQPVAAQLGRWKDSDLAALEAFPDLLYLGIEGKDVTDDGLVFIRDFSKLRRLCLSDTSVGDDGLEHVATMPHLRALSLSRTNVTDGGLAKLRSLGLLRLLDVSNTKVSQQGAEGLKQVLPQLSIVPFDPLPDWPQLTIPHFSRTEQPMGAKPRRD